MAQPQRSTLSTGLPAALTSQNRPTQSSQRPVAREPMQPQTQRESSRDAEPQYVQPIPRRREAVASSQPAPSLRDVPASRTVERERFVSPLDHDWDTPAYMRRNQ
jgi:hypothetical protein